MKKMKITLILIFVCYAMLGQQNVQAVSHDANVYLTTVSTGNTLEVTIEAEILLMDLYAAGIILAYDPTILSYNKAEEGDLFRNWAEFKDPTNCTTSVVDGVIVNPCTFFNVSPYDVPPYDVDPLALQTINIFWSPTITEGVPGGWSGSLAILSFEDKGGGASRISIESAEFSDSNWNMLNVNVVPEPSTLILLGSGLIALGVKRFKGKA